MVDLKTWLKEVRQRKDYSQAELAEWLSQQTNIDKPVTARAVSHWERGDNAPTYIQFLYLCIFAGVTDPMATFLGHSPFRLNQEGRRKLEQYTNDLAEVLEQSAQYALVSKSAPTRLLRLYDIPASAGTGQFLDGEQYEMVEVDETVPSNADFGIRVSGDSMIPRFAPGQIVWVREQATLEDGEFGVFSLNGDAFIKKLGRVDGRPRLVSLNKKYAPIEVMEADNLTVFGKVVG